MISKRLCLVVADDDTDLREWLRLSLEHKGATVLEAATGSKLETLLLGEPSIDLAITDVEMPEMSGLQACLAARQRGVSVPVIFITGHLDRQIVDEARAVGNAVILCKPFGLDDLHDQIARLLHRASSQP
jgi:DNA-binding response OmpR family regulator